MPRISVSEAKFKKQNFCWSSFPNVESKCMCHFFNLYSWKTGRSDVGFAGTDHARSTSISEESELRGQPTWWKHAPSFSAAAPKGHYVHGNSLWMRPTVWDWQPSAPHLKPGRDLEAERRTQQTEPRKKQLYNSTHRSDRPKYIFIFSTKNKSFSISRWDMNLFIEFAIINLCLEGKIFFGGCLHFIWKKKRIVYLTFLQTTSTGFPGFPHTPSAPWSGHKAILGASQGSEQLKPQSHRITENLRNDVLCNNRVKKKKKWYPGVNDGLIRGCFAVHVNITPQCFTSTMD